MAPGPEAVLTICRAVLSAAANHSLEGVGVSIDKTRKQGAVFEVNWILNFIENRKAVDVAYIIANNSGVVVKMSAYVDQIRQPGY
jgi:hypothetical protein